MSVEHRAFSFPTPDATARHASTLATTLEPGDVVLLQGDVGAGKSHFARALIQSLLPVPEDVPSPTFTLVQTYELDKGDLWHADLYRLTSTNEIEELGLTEAFETDICLIEWPERLGLLTPANALTLRLEATSVPDERKVIAHWSDPKWTKKLRDWQS
ncbi:MAG: tRNA (adenosine(37)-N6)-threonylcarbamoyltransferase complex ATPase subunit type 1 TsaE [Sulfitobacter sp.]